MSDLRYDPVFDLWVAIAENRRERPIEFLPLEQVRKQLICPFCLGNEDETPGAVLVLDENAQALPADEAVDWLVRIVPNKFPTFDRQDRLGAVDAGPYNRSGGNGLQEVIIPSPRHVISMSELLEIELLVALQGAQARLREFQSGPGIEHGMLFMNCRSEAGASIEHVHLQLLGSPVVSSALNQRARRMADFRCCQGRSLMESIAEFELAQQVRVVAATPQWLMCCPFASRHAFQVWLIPRQAQTPFQFADRSLLVELVELTQHYVNRIESMLGHPGYNWLLHQSPFAEQEADHWFIEIFPRLAKTAGYELGTDIWINAVSPELAAKRLR